MRTIEERIFSNGVEKREEARTGVWVSENKNANEKKRRKGGEENREVKANGLEQGG